MNGIMKGIIIGTIGLIVGTAIGWIGFAYFGPVEKLCQIKYVSQEELIDLENARIKQEAENQSKDSKENNSKDNELFFDRSLEAIELIEEVVGEMKDSHTKVIWTISPILNKGAISISKEVHRLVIAKMKGK